MKVVKFKGLKFIPASHEDPKNPGVLKKVLFVKDDLIKGRVQMINWAHLPKGKSFQKHYHEDMEEIFIIVTGKVRMRIDDKEIIMEKGDGAIVPIRAVHSMTNIGSKDADYIALGITQEENGKTIVIE